MNQTTTKSFRIADHIDTLTPTGEIDGAFRVVVDQQQRRYGIHEVVFQTAEQAGESMARFLRTFPPESQAQMLKHMRSFAGTESCFDVAAIASTRVAFPDACEALPSEAVERLFARVMAQRVLRELDQPMN